MSTILTVSGLVTLAFGAWRSWRAARGALGFLVHDGDPTRTALEAARPMHARFRVRLFARQVIVAVGWLLVAMYGLYLASVGQVTG
jgi:hypothetical protein